MKHMRQLSALLALCLLLTACGAAPQADAPAAPATESPQAETPEAPAAPDPADPAFSPALDLTALRGVMTAEEDAALTAFLPVLQGEQGFALMDDLWESSQLREVTLPEFRDALFDGNYQDNPEQRPDALTMNGLAVQDVTGDGAPEVLLSFEDFGWFYLIFHQEGDQFYAVNMPVRGFQSLQTNGIYFASSGAGETTYASLSFQDGRFEERELAHKGGVTCTLSGQEATEADYDAWCAEHLAGDAYWYAADGSAGFWSAPQ